MSGRGRWWCATSPTCRRPRCRTPSWRGPRRRCCAACRCAIAGLYLRLADLGLPLDADQVAARRYLEITAPEIRQAFAMWLRPADLAQVVKGPTLAQ